MTTAVQTQKGSIQASAEARAVRRRMLRRQRLARALTYLVGILISLWVLIPILFIASMALTTPAMVRSYPKSILPLIPFSTDTMEFFLNSRGILPGIINSVTVAFITLVLSTLIAAPAGYAISRFLFRGRDIFRLSILAVRAFPIVVLSIPLAVVFLRLNIYDNVFSLAMMHTALALPTTILVLSSVFSSIPYELEEAAQVFGCSPAQAFRHIVLPLVLPGIAAAAIFTFVLSWNEVFAASILAPLENRTLPVQVLITLDESSEPYQFAGGFFMLIPALIFIFFIRRYLFNMWGQITK
ncbi:MAG: sugar ABC transporter permease [Chloroflexi bacterium RBG_16_56_8]|nr:MAG: sugar ABC transporter permease [Chloroflexi bacterium RBG_16_56_8]